MKFLVVTQILDKNDPVLGFFHRWVEKLAERFDRITVIALSVGEYTLPSNVSVYSLGKEGKRRSPFEYGATFLRLIFKLRKEYDAVFVHMNQEYILLAGWLWRLWGKRVYLWRNHYAGSWLTDSAVALSDKVFYTSAHSYTARFKNAHAMPVGVDLERFSAGTAERPPHTILFLARMAPSKRPEMLLDALSILKEKNITCTAHLYGSPLPQNSGYYENLKKRAVGLPVIFHDGVSNSEAAALYRTHQIFVNCSPSGMFDKTIFEAAASGCMVLAASEDWGNITGAEYTFKSTEELVVKLETALSEQPGTFVEKQNHLKGVVSKHSLDALVKNLTSYIP